VKSRNLEAISVLIEAGADFNARTMAGKTILNAAVGSKSTFEALIEAEQTFALQTTKG
jgi:hypothetical protein